MYDLQFGKGLVMCAREIRFDHGYYQKNLTLHLRSREDYVEYTGKAERNYARYINTLSEEQQEYLEFNVEFVGAADGTQAILVKTTKDVFAGEELWIDYGSSFTVVGATAEPREVAEEPLRDED